MVSNSNLTGVGAPGTHLDKGEVWEEDLEEGEISETEEGGDLEKGVRGAVSETSNPDLLESLLTPEEAQHQGLADASKKLIPIEKIIVSLLVVSFVLVEAYFVGRSLRNRIDNNEHLHDDNSKSMKNTEFEPTPLPLDLPVLVTIDGDGAKDSIALAQPFEEVFSDGSFDFGKTAVRESLDTSPVTKTSTTMTRSSPDLQISSQLPLSEDDDSLSAENDDDGGS